MTNDVICERSSYVVIPQGEYKNLCNKQYLELTTLRKIVDPEDKREKYLETTLKTHYPNVYDDMIRNDYVLTNSTGTQEHLDNFLSGDYETKKQVNLHIHKRSTKSRLENKERYPYPTPRDSLHKIS